MLSTSRTRNCLSSHAQRLYAQNKQCASLSLSMIRRGSIFLGTTAQTHQSCMWQDSVSRLPCATLGMATSGWTPV